MGLHILFSCKLDASHSDCHKPIKKKSQLYDIKMCNYGILNSWVIFRAGYGLFLAQIEHRDAAK